MNTQAFELALSDISSRFESITKEKQEAQGVLAEKDQELYRLQGEYRAVNAMINTLKEESKSILKPRSNKQNASSKSK